jgi:3-hydroxyisobutyrate dehydrogenase
LLVYDDRPDRGFVLKSVYLGDDGVLSTVRTGALLIDSSTVDPSTSLEMSQAAAAKAAVYMVG